MQQFIDKRSCGHEDFFRSDAEDLHAVAKLDEFRRTRCAYCVRKDHTDMPPRASKHKDVSPAQGFSTFEEERRRCLSDLAMLQGRLFRKEGSSQEMIDARLLQKRLDVIAPLARQERIALNGKQPGVRTRSDRMDDVLRVLEEIRDRLQKFLSNNPA